MADLKGYRIWLDAGHGGTPDPSCDAFGTAGQVSGAEKDVNLDVAQRLRTLLQSRQATVNMTRTTDSVVCLASRAAQANEWAASIFISIHHNGHNDRSVQGTETYWYKPIDRQLAEFVHGALLTELNRSDRGLRPGNFKVLRDTKMTAILTEAVYQTNSSDDAFIADEDNRQQEAVAIADGICAWVDTLPPI